MVNPRKLIQYYSLEQPRKGLSIAMSKLNDLLVKSLANRSSLSFNPSTFIIKVTDRCNLRCPHCGQWGSFGAYLSGVDAVPRSGELPTSEWIKFIQNNYKRIHHIFFWGGEPFLRKDLLTIVKVASDNGITSEITTNGVLLSESAQSIIDSGVDSLYISLDGPEEIHNRLTMDKENSYKKIISGLRKINNLKLKNATPLPILQVIMTLTVANQNYIYDVYEIARKEGADVFRFQFGIFTSDEVAKKSSEMFQKEFGKEAIFWNCFVRDMSKIDTTIIKNQIEKVKRVSRRRGQPVYAQTPDFDFDLEDYFKRPDKKLTQKQCLVPWKYLQIRPNGDIALCTDFPDLTIGNILNEDWRKVWNNDIMRKYRTVLSHKGIFPACGRCCAYLSSCSKSRLSSILNNK